MLSELWPLLRSLPGPYFDFLVFEEGGCWERAGRVQRVVGIKSEFFHRPDALRVPAAVMWVLKVSFEQTHPKFNFWGPTEYAGAHLHALLGALEQREQALRGVTRRREFRRHLSPIFTSDFRRASGPWHLHWTALRDEVIALLAELGRRIRTAMTEAKSLLVLGI